MEKYNQKYLIPAKRTAPVKKKIEENPAPCVMPYTMKGNYGTADTTLVLVKNKKGEAKAFITNLKVDASQAEHLFELYKNRWTVDTSYRMVGEVRMNTKTLDYRVRWVLFFLSVLLMNGYWLFNDVIKAYDHVSLITFAELHVEARHVINPCTDTDFG
jgi:IS4 transposase